MALALNWALCDEMPLFILYCLQNAENVHFRFSANVYWSLSLQYQLLHNAYLSTYNFFTRKFFPVSVLNIF